ncbi:MAG: pseudouridine synthase [Myxococcota bacterium]
MAKQRLQKIIARAGCASRRKSEEFIRDGRVRVNGRIVRKLGSVADSRRDRIELDGKRIVIEKPAYYVFHKPREVVSTLADPEGRASIAEYLRHLPERMFPVGRLDYQTSGVLLLTNDGHFAEALASPRSRVPKYYAVKMQGHLSEEDLAVLRQGVVLDDGYQTRPSETYVLREEPRTTWLRIVLTEGKNRQIRRMGDAIGHRVLRLVRESVGGVTSGGLKPGSLRPVTSSELEKLRKKYVNPHKSRKQT